MNCILPILAIGFVLSASFANKHTEFHGFAEFSAENNQNYLILK